MLLKHLALALVGASAAPAFSAPAAPVIHAWGTIQGQAPLPLQVDACKLDLALPVSNQGRALPATPTLDETVTFASGGRGQGHYQALLDAVNQGKQVSVSIAFTYPFPPATPHGGENTLIVSADLAAILSPVALPCEAGDGPFYTFQVENMAFDASHFTQLESAPDIWVDIWYPNQGTGSIHLFDHQDVDVFRFTPVDAGGPGGSAAAPTLALEVKRPWGGDVALPNLLTHEISDPNFSFTNYQPYGINVSPTGNPHFDNDGTCWFQMTGGLLATRATICTKNQAYAWERGYLTFDEGF